MKDAGSNSGTNAAAKTAGVISLAALAGVALLSAFRRDEVIDRAGSSDALPREVLISAQNMIDNGVETNQGSHPETLAAFSTGVTGLPQFSTEPSVKLSEETSVMLVGGGVIPPEVASLIAARCFQLSKLPQGGDGSLLICSYATSEPSEGFARAQRIFSAAGATEINYLPPPDDPNFSLEEWNGLVDRASGIFFTGGDQKKIYSRLFSRNLLPELHSRFERGPCILGGTSAGTAIMSPTMIAGGPLVDLSDWPELYLHKTDFATFSHGISVVPFITDQHFSEKNRGMRLTHSVDLLGQAGIGVDENTAVHFLKGRFLDVYGEGGVTVVFPSPDGAQIFDKRITAGGRFDLHKRNIFVPADTIGSVALVSEIGE